MDTLLYDLSIPAISQLQDTFSGQANLMQTISTVFDPKYAFLIYSPLAYLLDPKIGKRLIMTTVLAEWSNQILKWFLHGERPYWYVHSSGHFDTQQVSIKQFPSTCELGPGHPSGHAMVTAAVWYIILNSLLQAYHNYQSTRLAVETKEIVTTKTTKSPAAVNGLADATMPSTSAAQQQQLATYSTWLLYATLIVMVSLSRVVLGCHFPHQCLAGASIGLLVARWASSQKFAAKHYVVASLVLFVTAFGTYGLLQALGFDPNWTIRLATKHCIKREYIHLDTAPFFSIMRYCGFALGCGLGLMFPLKASATVGRLVVPDDVSQDVAEIKSPLSSRNLSWFSIKIVMALIMARLVDNLGLFVSHTNLNLFYSCAFIAYTLFSYAFINF